MLISCCFSRHSRLLLDKKKTFLNCTKKKILGKSSNMCPQCHTFSIMMTLVYIKSNRNDTDYYRHYPRTKQQHTHTHTNYLRNRRTGTGYDDIALQSYYDRPSDFTFQEQLTNNVLMGKRYKYVFNINI